MSDTKELSAVVRVLVDGPAGLSDLDILHEILIPALLRRKARRAAEILLLRFGSLADVIAAPMHELSLTEGVGKTGATALKAVQAVALRLLRCNLLDRPVMDNWDSLSGYLRASMAWEPVERFRVLFLDGRDHLLVDEVQATGTVNHVPVYPREVVRRALELHASGLILAHNHPSGDPMPSREDLTMTRDIADLAWRFGIRLRDHVIVGRNTALSLREAGLLAGMQDAGCPRHTHCRIASPPAARISA